LILLVAAALVAVVGLWQNGDSGTNSLASDPPAMGTGSPQVIH
jgi:hypothetical protein